MDQCLDTDLQATLVVCIIDQLNAPKGYGTPRSVVLDQRRVQAQADAATKDVSTFANSAHCISAGYPATMSPKALLCDVCLYN